MELDSWYSGASSSRDEDGVDEGGTDVETGMAQDPQDRGSPLLYTGRCMTGEIGAIKCERDTIQREIDELQDLWKDAWAPKAHAGRVTEERDALKAEAELNAEIKRNIMKEKDALRLETKELKAQCEHTDELKEQSQFLMQKCHDITLEKDAWVLNAQIIEADRTVLKRKRNDLKLEKKNIPAILEEALKEVTREYDSITRERDRFQQSYLLSSQACKSLEKTIEALKDETKELRTKVETNALLKEQLNDARHQCEDMRKEINAFLLSLRGPAI
jgi:chromosome segregation ATPase